MKIKVFRIEEEFKGDSYSLSPRVPTNIQNGEDSITPRICVCPTVFGCLDASQMCIPLSKKVSFEDIYLYSAELDTEKDSIYQPNENEVPDAFKTGELWVLNDVEFKLEKIYKVRLFIAGINIYYIYSSDVEEYIKENGYIINSIDGFKYCTR